MMSVIIAAHDEEHVIGSCLDALKAQVDPGPIQIIVSANGCSDDTAGVARRRGATVVERVEAGKPGALNAAEDLAAGFPRVYLDADILMPPHGLALLAAKLDDGALAAMPRRILDAGASPLLVRAYCAINERLPVFRNGLFGRGMIAVSAAGRARFDRFPDMVADDLFLDAQFSPAEKGEVRELSVVVQAPRTITALHHRLVRVRRGNAEMRAASARGAVTEAVRSSDRWAWLRDVVLPHPWLAFAAIPYVAITVAAAVAGQRDGRAAITWGRDSSTRARPGTSGANAAL
ncbi:glycosyltransferase [Agrococcus sp. Ld7]|uniref:glycosyltransferase n=1 Tax=Agrococcus sp. Ld7 TaxID=649148 RepID=UPI00386EC969